MYMVRQGDSEIARLMKRNPLLVLLGPEKYARTMDRIRRSTLQSQEALLRLQKKQEKK